MPLLRISARGCTPAPHDGSGTLEQALARHLADPACGKGPVIIMVHGYKYTPLDNRHCPHRAILSLAPEAGRRHALSWPRHLGFGRGRADEGLALAFGWHARGAIWHVSTAARVAGAALAETVAQVTRLADGRPVHIVAHSLGARVALSALQILPAQSVQNVILLAGAEYQSTTARALLSPGGAAARVLNVTSRENALFDRLAETFIAPPFGGDRVLGKGWLRLPNLATLRLDDPASLAALARAGFRIAPPAARICHWSPYMRPGVFPLYRALLRGEMGFAALCHLLPRPAGGGRPAPPPLAVPPLSGLPNAP